MSVPSLFVVERDRFWCPSACKLRCSVETCKCAVCHCPACRRRTHIALHGRTRHTDLPPRPGYQARLIPIPT